jgi:hypothetical protein
VATEQAVEQVVETVADNLEEAAVVVRHINAQRIAYSLGGLAVGVAVGFFFGYRWNKAKIRAEAFKESEEEVEKIREMYRDSARVIRDKPSLDEVVEERQYVIKEEAIQTVIPTEEVEERPTRPPVPVDEPRQDPRVPPGPGLVQYGAPPPKGPTINLETGKSNKTGWDFAEELATRSEEHPYIIHQDEYMGNETGYKQEVLTWYSGDNVLTDEDEQPIPDADDTVDLNHMSRFGHGTDDFNVIFIRNDRLRMEYEICRMPTSYEEERQGLTNDDEPH